MSSPAPLVLERDDPRRAHLVHRTLDGDPIPALALDQLATFPQNPHVLALYKPRPGTGIVVGRSTSAHTDRAPELRHPTLDLAGWMLHLPWATNPTPMNRSGATHGWRVDAAAARRVRETAYTLALHRIPAQPRIRVRLDWHVTTRRTRDEDNLVRCMKHLVDGLRLAGVVHDDTRQHVLREMPTIVYHPAADGGTAHMRLWIHRAPTA